MKLSGYALELECKCRSNFASAETLLAVKLLNIGRDLLRASIARMYIRALAGGIPPNPNAAWMHYLFRWNRKIGSGEFTEPGS